MNKQEAIEYIKGNSKMAVTVYGSAINAVSANLAIASICQIDEKPLCLRNVLARLRGLPEHDREVWLKSIMGEFKKDFSHAKWCEGYEQGKFDGAVEAEKPNTVVIPQFVAEWLEGCKGKKQSLYSALQDCDSVNNWLDIEGNEELFARAWLDGYDVEKEGRYEVSIKASGQYLARTKLKEIAFMYKGACSRFTRKELEEDGFGWVFDCDGVKVEEVE